MEEIPEARHADERRRAALFQPALDLGAAQFGDVNDARADDRGDPQIDHLRVGMKERQQAEHDLSIGDAQGLLDAVALGEDISVRERHGFGVPVVPDVYINTATSSGALAEARRQIREGAACAPILESRKTIGPPPVAQGHGWNSAAQPFADRAEFVER